MNADVQFRMPPIEGVDLGDPTQLGDYLGSLGQVIAKALRDIVERMNDARFIMVPSPNGMRPLSKIARDTWRPGDVKLFAGTLAEAKEQRRYGWVRFTGRDGTVNADDRYFKAPAADANPNEQETETVGTTTRVIPVSGCSPDGLTVSGSLSAITFIPLMKL